MNIIQRTYNLLTETEKNLAQLASEAGATRDYDQATSLIEVARRIKQMAEQFDPDASKTETRPISVGRTNGPRPGPQPNTPTRVRNKLGQYPKFLREGENLVKIGWSKSQRSDYEHKSPKRVLGVLCESLRSADGKRIMMDKVLPLKDPVSGSHFPDYQSYLCLAWLRSAGLVVQHGRQGYSLPKGIELEKSVEALWADLPTR